MRLLICAGGTGGGVYPALTVLQALKRLNNNDFALNPLWVGAQGGIEQELVNRANIPFQTIPAAGVHGVALRSLPRNIGLLLKGLAASLQMLKQFQPDVLLFTGGYVAVPMAVAASLGNLFHAKKKYKAVLFIPDIEPGLALKVLAWFATRIAVVNQESYNYIPKFLHKRISVTGYPTRLEDGIPTPAEAREVLGLNEELPVILVSGGSTGARSLNHALLTILPELLNHYQVIHLSGARDWELVNAASQRIRGSQPDQPLPAFPNIQTHPHASRYHAYPYLHEEMAAALASTDLVVSRAGASCLGEYPLFRLPAILVPYPYAWRYQKVNAGYLVKHGAAILLEDANLNAQLLNQINQLFNQPDELERMKENMGLLNMPSAASNIAKLIAILAIGQSMTNRLQQRSEETTR